MMFSNIGQKIKMIAKAWFYIGEAVLLIGEVFWVVLGGKEHLWRNLLLSLLLILLCTFVFGITSILLYGFGHLIVNSDLSLAIQCQKANEDSEELYKEWVLYEWKRRGLISKKEYREKKQEWNLK